MHSEFQENQPRLSPNGHWLAYRSNESKRNEIYVVGFPTPNRKWPISTNGGQSPVWSRDGGELYYYSPDGYIMAVDIKLGAQPQFGIPKILFRAHLSTYSTTFDVTRDGRFLLPALVDQETAAPMTVVLNWPGLLKK
jgi:hypothetical protein